MVDESGQVSTLGGVHHIVKINTKQVGGPNTLNKSNLSIKIDIS